MQIWHVERLRLGEMVSYALFHLNLNYSSIDTNRHTELLERCYWPFLRLVSQQSGTITLEASGNSLEMISDIDADWVKYAKALVSEKKLDVITGGYHQIIGPLVPPEVNLYNLRRGREALEKLFEVCPTALLPSEQAFSQSLIPVYAEAGFDTVILDFDNFKSSFTTAPAHQKAFFSGSSVEVLWCSSVAYQRFQRVVHDEISFDEFSDRTAFDSNRVWAESPYPIYSGDLEIFGVRPGRYGSERQVIDKEWGRVGEALEISRNLTSSEVHGVSFIQTQRRSAGALGPTLAGLTVGAQPTLVKKQPKYNLSRWALTGRDDLSLNGLARRYSDRAEKSEQGLNDFALSFYASDYRTHITNTRWRSLRAELDLVLPEEIQTSVGRDFSDFGPAELVVSESDNGLSVSNSLGEITLDKRRGISTTRFRSWNRSDPFAGVGKIPHGSMSPIDLTPDWFSGNLVLQEVGRGQVTDLGPTEPQITQPRGTVRVESTFTTAIGSIRKSLDFYPGVLGLKTTYRLPRYEMRGTVRFGFVSAVIPLESLKDSWYETHLGGYESERLYFPSYDFDQSAPLSLNLSCRTVIPIVDGVFRLKIGGVVIRYTFDPASYPFCGLLSSRVSAEGYLVRFCLSAREVDETSLISLLPERDISYELALESL